MQLGLKLNHAKTVIITNDSSVQFNLLLLFPNAHFIKPSYAPLLGSPIDNVTSIITAIFKKTQLPSLMGEVFQHIFEHDATVFLRNVFVNTTLLPLI